MRRNCGGAFCIECNDPGDCCKRAAVCKGALRGGCNKFDLRRKLRAERDHRELLRKEEKRSRRMLHDLSMERIAAMEEKVTLRRYFKRQQPHRTDSGAVRQIEAGNGAAAEELRERNRRLWPDVPPEHEIQLDQCEWKDWRRVSALLAFTHGDWVPLEMRPEEITALSRATRLSRSVEGVPSSRGARYPVLVCQEGVITVCAAQGGCTRPCPCCDIRDSDLGDLLPVPPGSISTMSAGWRSL